MAFLLDKQVIHELETHVTVKARQELLSGVWVVGAEAFVKIQLDANDLLKLGNEDKKRLELLHSIDAPK